MKKIMYTEEQINAIYDEVDRRIEIDTEDGAFRLVTERWEYREAMIQGVYSALKATAWNWQDVAYWCRIEEDRYDDEWKAVEALKNQN